MNHKMNDEKNNKRSVEKGGQQSIGKEVREHTGEKNQLIKKKIPINIKVKDKKKPPKDS